MHVVFLEQPLVHATCAFWLASSGVGWQVHQVQRVYHDAGDELSAYANFLSKVENLNVQMSCLRNPTYLNTNLAYNLMGVHSNLWWVLG